MEGVPTKTESTRGPSIGRLGDFLGFRMRRLQNRLSRTFGEATRDFNLRSGLFSSLEIIKANPGISQQNLSEVVGLDKSVTVMIVDLLEERGFAERRKSKNDRRRYSLYVTSRGEEELRKLFAIMARTENGVLHGVSEEELHWLMDILDRLYANLED